MFSKGITHDLREKLAEIVGKRVRGMVLDLRNNPGGLLDEAVDVASQFLQGGNVLLEKNSRGKVTATPVKPGGLAPNLALVVLINGGSASGAEIVAGALQDAGRAKLVGETTFGTGTVLRQFPLSDGSALLLAVQEWLTPDGHTIWHKGIKPDVTVPLPANIFPLLPETVGGMTREALMKSHDTQLLRALRILEESAFHR
jgi:carboxyl-terminal processing protease